MSKKYAEDLLSLAHLTDTKVTNTPLELTIKLIKDDGQPLSNPTLYRRLVGSLVNLTMTHPDLAHAMQVVSQFVSDPHKPHLIVVHHILRCIHGTINQGLFYSTSFALAL